MTHLLFAKGKQTYSTWTLIWSALHRKTGPPDQTHALVQSVHKGLESHLLFDADWTDSAEKGRIVDTNTGKRYRLP